MKDLLKAGLIIFGILLLVLGVLAIQGFILQYVLGLFGYHFTLLQSCVIVAALEMVGKLLFKRTKIEIKK